VKGAGWLVGGTRPFCSRSERIGRWPKARFDSSQVEPSTLENILDAGQSGVRATLEAAQVEQWVSYGNVKVDRWIMREFVVPSVFFDKTKGPDTARIATALPEIDKCCRALDDAVAQTGHLVGSRLTYADMNVIPMLSTLLNFPAGKDILAKYSSLSAYVTRLADLPSFKNTAPPPRR